MTGPVSGQEKNTRKKGGPTVSFKKERKKSEKKPTPQIFVPSWKSSISLLLCHSLSFCVWKMLKANICQGRIYASFKEEREQGQIEIINSIPTRWTRIRKSSFRNWCCQSQCVIPCALKKYSRVPNKSDTFLFGTLLFQNRKSAWPLPFWNNKKSLIRM